MCCQETTTFDLPASVIEMLGAYRLRLQQHGWDWGEEGAELFRLGRLFEPIMSHMTTTFDIEGAFRNALAGLSNDFVVVTATDEGVDVRVPSPPLPVLPGASRHVDVVFVSQRSDLVEARVGDEVVIVPPGALAVRTIHVSPDVDLVGTVGDKSFRASDICVTAEAATLTLEAPFCARWSVTDVAGGSWFPDGVLQKWDSHGRPFFHADSVELTVPATELDVMCTRGLEYSPWRSRVTASAGTNTVVQG